MIEIHDVLMVPTDSLKPDPTNPNTMTREQMNGLRESFKRFGYLQPCIITSDNLIVDGAHRWEVYRESGRKEIPCIRLNLKDEAERRLLRQVMNKLHGEHEPLKDAQELKILFESNNLADLSRLIAADHLKLLKQIADLDGAAALASQTQVPRVYELVIECANQGEQERIYNELREEGFKIRILTL